MQYTTSHASGIGESLVLNHCEARDFGSESDGAIAIALPVVYLGEIQSDGHRSKKSRTFGSVLQVARISTIGVLVLQAVHIFVYFGDRKMFDFTNGLAGFYDLAGVYILGLTCYTIIIFINGGILLRRSEESAYIAAGFTFLPGTFNAILQTTILTWLAASGDSWWSRGEIIAISSYQMLDTIVRVCATVTALYAGYFWEDGAPEERGPVSSRSQGSEIDYSMGHIRRRSTCWQPLPAGASVWAYLAWFVTPLVIFLHLFAAIMPFLWSWKSPWYDDNASQWITYYFMAYLMMPCGIAFIVGTILLRSYRRVTYKSASYLFFVAACVHVHAMSRAVRSPEYYIESSEGLAVRGVCVAALLVAALGAWAGGRSMPRRHLPVGGGASRMLTSQV